MKKKEKDKNDYTVVNGFRVVFKNDLECSIAGYVGSEEEVSIPSTLCGRTVVGIEEAAFYKSTSIVKI